MTLDSKNLRDYYESLSDDALRAEYANGPNAYANLEVWRIVEATFAARFGIGAAPTSQGGAAAAAPVAPPALSAWFLVDRVFRARRWPTDKELPTTYLSFMGVLAGLSALVHLGDFFSAWSSGVFGWHLFPEHIQLPWVQFVNVAYPATLCASSLSRRKPAWYCLVWVPLVAVLSKPMVFLVYPFYWLYLARRRLGFGLAAWPSVM
jgi:hypothetical protein